MKPDEHDNESESDVVDHMFNHRRLTSRQIQLLRFVFFIYVWSSVLMCSPVHSIAGQPLSVKLSDLC